MPPALRYSLSAQHGMSARAREPMTPWVQAARMPWPAPGNAGDEAHSGRPNGSALT